MTGPISALTMAGGINFPAFILIYGKLFDLSPFHFLQIAFQHLRKIFHYSTQYRTLNFKIPGLLLGGIQKSFMNRFILFTLVFLSRFTLSAQPLKPGFDKTECIQLLEMGSRFGDSAYMAALPRTGAL